MTVNTFKVCSVKPDENDGDEINSHCVLRQQSVLELGTHPYCPINPLLLLSCLGVSETMCQKTSVRLLSGLVVALFEFGVPCLSVC